MITAEMFLAVIVVHIVCVFIITLISRGDNGKIARSVTTVISFTILGILICSVDHRNSWEWLLTTRFAGFVLLAFAAAHVVMIHDIRLKQKKIR